MRRIKLHTYEKLQYFKKYVEAYLVATKRLPKKYYIDAFAGTGKNLLCNRKCESKGGIKCVKCGKGKEIDGSVFIALRAKNKFDAYLIIELKQKNIKELTQFIKSEIGEELSKKINVQKGDANNLLKNIYNYIGNYTGCLILLDPEGPELSWNTIEALSRIKKIDLFILYPYDMSLVRLTGKFKEKLNEFYGNDEWFKIFKKYDNAEERRNELFNFYVGNLKKLGFTYVIYKVIRTRLQEGKSLYHFILATKNFVAQKIMNNVFDKEYGQQKLPKIT